MPVKHWRINSVERVRVKVEIDRVKETKIKMNRFTNIDLGSLPVKWKHSCDFHFIPSKRKNFLEIVESQRKVGLDHDIEINNFKNSVPREVKFVVEESTKKKLKLSDDELKVVHVTDEEKLKAEEIRIGIKFDEYRCQSCSGCRATFCGECTDCQNGIKFNFCNVKACLRPKFRTTSKQGQQGNNSEHYVNASIPSDMTNKSKTHKVTKFISKRILCKDCPGCKALSCNNCKWCNSDRKHLCCTKHCSAPRWERVPVVVKQKVCESPTKSLPDDRSSMRLVGGVLYDFRCTICKTIPRMLNRSELYRHYSTEHFNLELKNEFGHLKICPFCNMEFLGGCGGSASHFGQKHDMVEKFLPMEARIPRSLKVNKKRTKTTELMRAQKKILEFGAKEDELGELGIWLEVPAVFDINGELRRVHSVQCPQTKIMKVSKIDGFEIEYIMDVEEDLNGNLAEPKVFTPEHNDQHSSIVSSSLQLVLCKVCNTQFSSAETIVFHIQFDHHMKGPDNSLDCSFKTLLKSGHVQLVVTDKESGFQDDIVQTPVSKTVAAQQRLEADLEANNTAMFEKNSVLMKSISHDWVKPNKFGTEMTAEERELLQAVESIQDTSSEVYVEEVDMLNSRWDTFIYGFENSLK